MNRLREAGWGFKRKGKRAEVWKKKGDTARLNLPTLKSLSELEVKAVLTQAGLSREDIQRFLSECVKDEGT